jgi:hypothetical protein
MEIIKLNLHSQVLFLGKLIKDSETNQILNTSNNNISNNNNNKKELAYYYFSYDDQINKKLMVFELLVNNDSNNEQKKIYEIKYLEDIGNINIHLFARANLINKIYFIFISNDINHLYAGIYDLEINKYFPIILESSEESNKKIKEIIKQIPQKDYISILEQNRLFFFGGLLEEIRSQNEQSIPNEEKTKTDYSLDHNKINKSCIFFDIEKLEFEKQKFPEFSLIPRYKFGGASQNGIIYILGGFSSLSNREENICNLVQFGKYFDEKMYKFSMAKIEGESPKDMIDNDLLVIQNRYLVSFSGYKYLKIWVMDTKTNKGINIDLKEKLKLEEYNKRDLIFNLLSCTIDEENNINNNENNNITSSKNIHLLIVKIIYNNQDNGVNFKFMNISFKYDD